MNALSNSHAKAEILANLTRAGFVESSHFGHLLLLDKNGKVIIKLGDESALIYPRSSIKAMQASAMVRNGLDLSPRLLALTCASHAGSKMHQAAAVEILASVGLNESYLKNTPQLPLGDKESREYGLTPPSRLVAACSGKHAGMLATCAINNWDLESYLSPEHPLQKAIVKEVENLIEGKIESVTADGCGAPLFLATAREWTNGFHNFFKSSDPIHQRIYQAITAHPEMVAGENEIVTKEMQSHKNLFVKDGAEGIVVAGFPTGEVLFAKGTDGQVRWGAAVIRRALELWEIPMREAEKWEIYYSYGAGVPVGEMKANF